MDDVTFRKLNQSWASSIMFIVRLESYQCPNMYKRIMNKVLSCTDDCNVNIYYQDTDSIHLNYDDVGKNVKRYKHKCDQR